MEGLKRMESFEEFPDKVLIVNKDSDIYYLFCGDHGNKRYVVWKNVDSVERNDADTIWYTNSYYDIISGRKILTEKVLTCNGKILKPLRPKNEAKAVLLSAILNLKGNSEYELTKNDIIRLTDYKELKAERHRKTYF